MKNKRGSILVGIIAVIIILVLAGGIGGYFYINKFGKLSEGIHINKMWDADGNLISGTSQAIVNGQAGVKYVSYSIVVKNTDTVPLTFTLTSASDSAFSTSLGSQLNNQVIVNAGQQIVWNTEAIDMTTYVGSNANFTATISATSNQRQSSIKTVNLIIPVSPDTTAQFEVTLGSGTSTTTNSSGTSCVPSCSGKTCGSDGCVGSCGTCTSSQTCTNSICIDAGTVNNVKFRTTDPSYVSGTAIAYTSTITCGSNLVAYGYTTAGSGGTSCSNLMSTNGYSLVLSGLPGGWRTGYNAPSLYKYAGTSANKIRLCQDTTGSSGYYKEFDASDPDASKVSILPTVTGINELNC